MARMLISISRKKHHGQKLFVMSFMFFVHHVCLKWDIAIIVNFFLLFSWDPLKRHVHSQGQRRLDKDYIREEKCRKGQYETKFLSLYPVQKVMGRNSKVIMLCIYMSNQLEIECRQIYIVLRYEIRFQLL